MGVSGARVVVMVVLQAECATTDVFSTACEGLVVEACIRYRPVEVLPSKGFPPVTAVIGYPLGPLVVPFCSDNCCLVGK